MTPEDLDRPMQMGADSFDEMLRRPRECSELDMELKTAIELKDVACCRELLREKGQWLAEFKGHELAELMDAAIKTGDAADELVTLLLEAGVPSLCVRDNLGPDYQHTPLVTAARLGRLDLVQTLAAAGADVFWASPTGTNALSEILPSHAGQAPLADTPEMARVREWLTQQGLRIDPHCADSRRKLSWATGQPASWPDVPALLALGIPLTTTGWTPFMLDMALGVADACAVAGLAADELPHRDTWSRTPFLLAVTAGDLQMAQALFQRGSDLRAKGHCGATALHLAAEQNHCHMLEWLLASGHPLEARDDFGHSPLHAAVSHNSVEAAALLFKNGADVRERDSNGFALIHSVSFTEDLVMLKLLLGHGGGTLRPGQHVDFKGKPLASLFLTMLASAGIEERKFADATERLSV